MQVKLRFVELRRILNKCLNFFKKQWRTEGGGCLGVQTPPSKSRSLDKVEINCKLSGKCLVFLFQHPD